MRKSTLFFICTTLFTTSTIAQTSVGYLNKEQLTMTLQDASFEYMARSGHKKLIFGRIEGCKQGDSCYLSQYLKDGRSGTPPVIWVKTGGKISENAAPQDNIGVLCTSWGRFDTYCFIMAEDKSFIQWQEEGYVRSEIKNLLKK